MEKNPYERDESVEIPDFPSIKDESEEIDRSMFKMEENEVEEDDDEEYYEKEVTYRKVRQSVIVIAIALLVLFLVLGIVGIVYGSSKKKALNTLQAEYDSYKTTATSKETALNAQITELKAQIEELTKKEEVVEAEATYRVVVDSIRVRNAAKVDGNNFADYNSLSDSVKKLVSNDTGVALVVSGTDIGVIETTTNGNETWGRIDKNAWICLSIGSDQYCTKN